MNNLEFRAWHHDLGIMLYSPNPFSSSAICEPPTKILDENSETGETYLHAFMTWDGRFYEHGKLQNVTFLIFTGMYDIHKNKIWEGDIIREKIVGEDNYMYGEIKFKSPSFIVDRGNAWITKRDTIEVVGNIYENPELLETK